MFESVEEIGRHITPLLRQHGVVRAGIFRISRPRYGDAVE
jgi:hypothetical protein